MNLAASPVSTISPPSVTKLTPDVASVTFTLTVTFLVVVVAAPLLIATLLITGATVSNTQTVDENSILKKCQAVIPIEKGKAHPLCGLYHKSVEKEIEKLICADEHRMKILLEKINVDFIELSTFTHDKNHSVVENVNTPEEYKKIC